MISSITSFLSSNMLIGNFFTDAFWNTIYENFLNLCLAIDSIIYSIITWLYTIFTAIAEARVFTSETIMAFVNRLYLIIGIIALFFAAYIFLSIIINPDNMTKGNSSPAKLIRNIVLGIVCIVFIPTIFNFAYAVQGSIIEQNVIPRLFFPSSSTDLDQSINEYTQFGITIFEGSFYVKNYNDTATTQMYATCEQNAIRYNDAKYFSTCMGLVKENKVQYNFIVSGIIGLFVLFILVSYCIDIAVRTVKLCFLQIIAPFPSLLMMVPGQDKIFHNWLKDSIKTFFEVFAKIALLVFGIYLIQKLQVFYEINKNDLFKNFSPDVVAFSKLFIIMGIVIFLRRAPKLLEDIFGFKASNPLNIKKRFDESGITSIIGAVGGAAAGAYSSIKGAKARGGNQGLAAASGAFHGARLGGSAGWHGSLKGIGNAYNYGWANQQAWSHMDPDRGFIHNGVRVAGEMLRDNFGMQSYYEDLIDQARIKHDVQVSKNNRKIQENEQVYNQKANELDETYKYNQRGAANEAVVNAYKAADDRKKSEVARNSNLTTEAFLPLYNEVSGKYSVRKTSVSGAQLASYRDYVGNLFNDNKISSDVLTSSLASLDSAEKILGNTYDSTTLLSAKRDDNYFDGLTINDIETNTGTKENQVFESFINDFIENQKQQLDYDPHKLKYVKFDDLDSSRQQTLISKWRSDAKRLFESITVDSHAKDKYKTDVIQASNLLKVLDLMSLAQGPKDSQTGFIRDAAGQVAIEDSNGNVHFEVDKAVEKVSKSVADIVSGLDISKAIKSIKNQNVNGEREAKYRNTKVKVGNDEFNMAQIDYIIKSLREENTKLAKELETAQLAYQSDKQTSEAARKIGSLGRKDGGKH